MTIRQQGGIFGRNPTFNNVTVDGTLTVDQIDEKTGAAGITLDGVTLKDGNVVLANGKGIDFSATSGTGTSELFDDYEEGSFSGTIAGITATTATYAGTYTKLGNICHIQVLLTISGKTAGAGNPSIAVPFAAASTSTPQFGGQPTANGIFGSTDMYFAVYNGGTTVFAYNESAATLGAANWNDGVTAVNFTYKTA